MYINESSVIYFDSLGVEYIPKEIKKIVSNKDITTNICRIQVYDSIWVDPILLDFLILCSKAKV